MPRYAIVTLQMQNHAKNIMQLVMWQQNIVWAAHYTMGCIDVLGALSGTPMMHHSHLNQPWWLDQCNNRPSVSCGIHPSIFLLLTFYFLYRCMLCTLKSLWHPVQVHNCVLAKEGTSPEKVNPIVLAPDAARQAPCSTLPTGQQN